NFKKTHDRKAYLKRKFKYKPKFIQILGHPSTIQVKDQVENIGLKQSDIQLDLIKVKYLKADKNVPKDNIQFEKKSTDPLK
ncbi:4297_t:CDS:2, partial [Gigaspora margarita]